MNERIGLTRKDKEHKREIVGLVSERVEPHSSLFCSKEAYIRNLGICSADFELDDATNLVKFPSLDSYAFIAVTGTRETLNQLRDLLKADCDSRQQSFDQFGQAPGRQLHLGHPVLMDPQFELVALHPEHFLPGGAFLTIFNRDAGTYKTYVPSVDRRLCETPGDVSCPTPPPFSGPQRNHFSRLNPFFVILNAEIKFRRYYRQAEVECPPIPLPDDILELMKLTTEVVELIYWEPEIRPGTEGELAANARQAARRINEPRGGRPDPASLQESDVEMGGTTGDNEDGTIQSREQGHRRAYAFPWPDGADLKTRIELGTALISSHDCEYNSDDEYFLEELHSRSYEISDGGEKVQTWQREIEAF
ncbi:hypothetical protein BYT27DRAFT_7217715 [Phlegmacium glaucopus]|nr:hypothetical protein BYT27DRAFT_7217715 [Phlegmacium glaucopus]